MLITTNLLLKTSWKRSFLGAMFTMFLPVLFAPAHAEGPYQCPDLNNKDKISIDEMTQGKDGWFFRINSDLSSPLILTPEVAEIFGRFAAALKARGTQLVMAPIPPRAAIEQRNLDTDNPLQKNFPADKYLESYQRITALLSQHGVLMPNLLETSPPPNEMPSDKPFFFRRDHHWTPYGARAVAQKIAASLKESGSLANLTKTEYKTRIIDQSEWKPKLALEIQRLCSEPIPAEPYDRFETTRSAAADSADDLFGDTAASEPAVLVGSSFSAVKEYNFDGFLMEATGIEVANRAISAGMQFNAITSYVSSPAFEKAKPPFIIWEMPSLIDISQSALVMFRQIIPATYGVCTPENTLATNHVSIKQGKPAPLLKLNDDTHVSGNQYYLFVGTPNLGLAKFTLKFEYKGGDGDWFTVDRSEHFENTGRFFVELSDEVEGDLVSVDIDGLPNTNAELDVKLCKAPKNINTL